MSDWNAAQYLRFKEQRTRPAEDLARRAAALCQPHTVVDIGCGPGNSTAVLKRCFPQADILGVDTSPDMLRKAAASHPELRFQQCDARALTGTYDLLFSNACLQWVPDHAALLPSLMARLNPGGLLAVQMPMNGEEPLYRLMDEILARPQWALEDAAPQFNATLTPVAYLDILAEHAASFDLWETKYYHILPSHEALVDWVKGARLRPYLDRLGPERGALLASEIVRESKALYPLTRDGQVVLGFRRLFFTAIK